MIALPNMINPLGAAVLQWKQLDWVFLSKKVKKLLDIDKFGIVGKKKDFRIKWYIVSCTTFIDAMSAVHYIMTLNFQKIIHNKEQIEPFCHPLHSMNCSKVFQSSS